MEDLEAIEELIDEAKKIQEAGFINESHYETFKSEAIHGLRAWGDHWLRSLGVALKRASRKDSLKIIRYFHDECEHYALMTKIYKAKIKGEENERNT